MYRCYLCKEPVTKTEHREVKRTLGAVTEGEVTQITRDLGDDDFFDDEGCVVICRNCNLDAEIEVEMIFEEVEK